MHATGSQLDSGATFGRYVLVERLGRGAMGEVWAAVDPDLDRKIALKLLRRDRLARPEDVARLDAEARAMARLTHPNVVTIHDVGRLGDQLFIAMEFVDGEPLDQWIARGPHPYTEVLAILREAGVGLAAAHEASLVHRDFKPANVMIGRDGRVRVLDFGLARPEGSAAGLTTSGAVAREAELDDVSETRSRATMADGNGNSNGKKIQGTPAYMAPEQHRGADVDERSDLFSFCVSLYEALYGVRPFRGAGRMAVALAIVQGRIAELPPDVRARVPDWIHAIVLRGLATEPKQRYPDMRALLAALERSPQQRRRVRLAIAATVTGLAGVVGLALALMPAPEPDPCLLAGDAIFENWTDDARLELGGKLDAVAGLRRPNSASVGQRVIAGVDQHVAEWEQASEQLCRDRQAKRMTERLLTTRADCLAERLAGVHALVQLTADPAFVERLAARPLAGVRGLGDPSRCVDRAALADDRPTPTHAEHEARGALALRLAVEADPDALAAALARTTGDPESDPELALLYGRVALARGELTDAETRLHACAAVATARDDSSLAARAWLALVELELARLDPLPEPRVQAATRERASQLLAYAEALAPIHERSTRTELGLLAGRLALHEPEPARPPASLDQAVSDLVADPARAPDLLRALLDVRAQLYTRLGESSAAAKDRARAHTL